MDEGESQISREKVIAIIDNMVDYWAMFIMVHGQGEDAEVSVWTLMAELDSLKDKVNDLPG
jgi:hypothetical protein